MKLVVVFLIMGVLLYFMYKFIFGILGVGIFNEFVLLVILVIVGGGIYILLMIIFKVEEVDMILNIVKRKLYLKK